MPKQDPWKIYLNPLLLLEMQDKEREDDQQPVRRRHDAIMYARQVGMLLEEEGSTEGQSSATSDIPVCVKHVLMLAILLVHEACHLLNFHLSSNFSNRDNSNFLTSQRYFPVENGLIKRTFDDFGHMVEKVVFGYVIQHTFDSLLPSRFAIDEIVGMFGQYDIVGIALQPNPSLLGLITNLLDNAGMGITINNEMFPSMLQVMLRSSLGKQTIEKKEKNGPLFVSTSAIRSKS